MQVILFGTGAMACLFAVRLAQVAQVILLGTWAEAIAAIRHQGILIEDSQGSRTIRVQADFLGAQIEAADLVLVLVKSWQTANVARHLPDYVAPDGTIVTLQNGLGNIDLLGEKALPGTTAEGATLLGPGHVKAGGRGPTHLVAPAWVVDLFQRAGFESYRCKPDEAESLIWEKLSVSCGINALTAILRIPNGELLKNADTTELMVQAAMECAAVAAVKGIHMVSVDPAARVKEVAKNTAYNKSSMLQDILRGAPTECDAINGAVAREGKRLGVATPVNNTLWRLVRAAVFHSRSNLK